MSVYAELGQICPDFAEANRASDEPGRSMVEMVIAPAAEWFRLSDDQLVARVLEEFTLLHPTAAQATLLKSTIVRIPQSVYRARPGMDRFRPDQKTEVENFFLCGDYTRQEYLASMEGAVLSGKRVAARIEERFKSSKTVVTSSFRNEPDAHSSGPVVVAESEVAVGA